MEFDKLGQLHDRGIINIYSDRILLTTIKNDPARLCMTDLEFNVLWEIDIDKYARCIPVSQYEAMVVDDVKTMFIDLSNGKITSTEEGKYYLTKNESYQVLRSNDEGDIAVELPDKKIEIRTESINGLYFFNNCIVQSNYHKKNLRCYSLLDGEKIWEISFTDLLQSSQVQLCSPIIEYKGRLFFFLSDFIKKTVFSIDLASGQILNSTNEAEGWITLANDQLFVASSDKVKTIDPYTLNVEVADFSAALSPYGFRIQWNKFLVVGDLIYFVHENIRGEGEAIVGVLHFRTKALLWHTPVPIEEGSFWISIIKVHKNRFFVETQGGELHIFRAME
jgi:hypothetical protein